MFNLASFGLEYRQRKIRNRPLAAIARTVVVMALCGCVIFSGCSGCQQNGVNGNGKKTYRVGAILPLTGSAAQYGEWVKEGIEIAIEHLEEAHPGTQFDVIYQDDQNAPDRSVNALNKLSAVDGVPVVIGAVTSTCTTPIAPLAQAKKIVLVSPSASAPGLSRIGDYFFRVWSSDELAARQLAEQIVKQFKPKTLGILYVNNDYGQGVLAILSEELASEGVKVTAQEGYPPGNTDFRAHMTRLKAASPEVVLLVGYATELAYAVKQAAELDLRVPLVGQEGIESDKLLEVAGDAADGLIYFVPQFDPEDPDSKVQQFVASFKARFGGRAPEIFAAHGYDAMLVIGEAMLEADSGESSSIRDTLARTSGFAGVTGRISFDENGDVRKNLMMKMVKDGKFVVVRD